MTCKEHSGLVVHVETIRSDIRGLRKTQRWLVGAVLFLALTIGGTTAATKLLDDAPALVAVP